MSRIVEVKVVEVSFLRYSQPLEFVIASESLEMKCFFESQEAVGVDWAVTCSPETGASELSVMILR